MSLIKVEDIAFVRFRAPDLSEMAGFLEDFGLVPQVVDGVLYARGAGSAPFLHVTEEGDAGFAGVGLRAGSLADLDVLAQAEGLEASPLLAPGGGRMVRLTDPDGHVVEVVAGQAAAPERSLPARPPWNSAAGRP